jgi:hypothetical protein
MKSRKERTRQMRILGKHLVETPQGPVAVRLVRPNKESNWRWTATTDRVFAAGDTPEEACDNLRDSLKRK